jgi:hypothetical protein
MGVTEASEVRDHMNHKVVAHMILHSPLTGQLPPTPRTRGEGTTIQRNMSGNDTPRGGGGNPLSHIVSAVLPFSSCQTPAYPNLC